MGGIQSAKAEPKSEVREPPRLPPREVQELWFATRRRDWKSLAVVATAPRMSTLALAQALAEVAALIHGGSVRVRCAEGTDLEQLASLIVEMSGRDPSSVRGPSAPRVSWVAGTPGEDAARDGLIIAAVESVVHAPLLLPVALAADAVLLCVERAVTDVDTARHCIELIGRNRIVGAVLLDRS